MADCASLNACPFFNDKMEQKAGMAELYKKRYCKGDNTNCARWMVASTVGKTFVPTTLYPNQTDIAKKIITERK